MGKDVDEAKQNDASSWEEFLVLLGLLLKILGVCTCEWHTCLYTHTCTGGHVKEHSGPTYYSFDVSPDNLGFFIQRENNTFLFVSSFYLLNGSVLSFLSILLLTKATVRSVIGRLHHLVICFHAGEGDYVTMWLVLRHWGWNERYVVSKWSSTAGKKWDKLLATLKMVAKSSPLSFKTFSTEWHCFLTIP